MHRFRHWKQQEEEETTHSKYSIRTALTCRKLPANTITIVKYSDHTLKWPVSAGVVHGACSAINTKLTPGHVCIIWPWSTLPRWSQPPCHTQFCCAGRTEVWWRPGKRRRWKSSCSELGQLICRRGTGTVITTDKRKAEEKPDEAWGEKTLTQIKRHWLLALQAPCWAEPGPTSRMWQPGVQSETSLEWLLLLPKCKWSKCSSGDKDVISKKIK